MYGNCIVDLTLLIGIDKNNVAFQVDDLDIYQDDQIFTCKSNVLKILFYFSKVIICVVNSRFNDFIHWINMYNYKDITVLLHPTRCVLLGNKQNNHLHNVALTVIISNIT